MNNNKIILIVIILIISKIAFSQNDTTIVKQLSKPISNCETITLNAQEIISKFSINQYDSIYQVLRIWENKCGRTEPIERLKILLDIQQNRLVDTIYKTYILQLIPKFKNRVMSSKHDDYKVIFEYDKIYFDYLPLQSSFDNFTKKTALNLLTKQEKGTSEYLFCLLFSENIEQFNKTLNSSDYVDSYIYKTIYANLYNNNNFQLGNRMNLKISVGIWLPKDKLAETFKPAPQFSAFLGYNIYKSLYLDIGANLRPPIVDKNFDLNIADTTTSVNGKMCLTFGGWIYNEFKLNKNLFFDVVGGIGLGRIDTDLKRPKQSSDDVDKYYGVSTYDASLGINLRKRIFKTNSVGINFSYHYAPYNNDSLLHTDIGNQFMTISILFRLLGN